MAASAYFDYLNFQAVVGGRGENTYISHDFSLHFKFSCNLVGVFLISLVDWGGERALFPTTAVNCSVLFMVPAEYSDHCVLLQSINTLKFNGAFHNSQKLKTMALHKL